MSNKETHYRT